MPYFHQKTDTQPCGHEGQARVWRAHRRQIPLPIRFGAGYLALDDIEVALQTGELDGVAWCGFTEAYEVGWADVCDYALLNNVTGAWCGSYFANTRSWEAVPPHLQELFKLSMDSSHYYRQIWYWGGEAKLRVEGKKMELTTIPAAEWDQVVKDAEEFWDDVASISPRAAKVVQIFKDYTAVMEKAGVPYRYS